MKKLNSPQILTELTNLHEQIDEYEKQIDTDKAIICELKQFTATQQAELEESKQKIRELEKCNESLQSSISQKNKDTCMLHEQNGNLKKQLVDANKECIMSKLRISRLQNERELMLIQELETSLTLT